MVRNIIGLDGLVGVWEVRQCTGWTPVAEPPSFLFEYIPIVMRDGIGPMIVDNGKNGNWVGLKFTHFLGHESNRYSSKGR